MTERIGAHLRDLPLEDMREMLIARGEPEYRFRQLCQWLYGKLACGFDEMTDLPKPLRVSLAASFHVENARPALSQVSQLDGTRKHLFELNDGNFIEAVLMRYEKRTTLCISTQVGCPLDCVFCETAKGRFRRNLTAGEMLDQICVLRREGGVEDKKVNVVFLGMGEPLLNFEALVQAIGVLNHPLGMNLGSKRITVSTSGFPDRIRRLADEGLRCSLAVSLNAPDEAKRRAIMPTASRAGIAEILDAALYFVRSRDRRATLEYVMLAGVNTSDEDARALGSLAHGLPFKINLIPYNAGRSGTFRPTTEREIQRFIRVLLPLAPTVTVRRSRGADIDAACGQLWTNSLATEKKRPAEGAS